MNDDIITKIALERIADSLEEILRLVKKDMDDSKARITAQWDKELDKKDLPFPEVEQVRHYVQWRLRRHCVNISY